MTATASPLALSADWGSVRAVEGPVSSESPVGVAR
jgi:hypothetical protein